MGCSPEFSKLSKRTGRHRRFRRHQTNCDLNMIICDPAIAALMHRVAEDTSRVTADDLAGLAALHTQFQKLREEVNLAAPAEMRCDAAQLTARGEQLIEKLILGESDPEAALHQIVRAVEELQRTLNRVIE